MKIIKRKTAIAKGMPMYFTGKPCHQGHIAQRHTLTAACVECHRQHSRESIARMRDRIRLAREKANGR